MGMCFNCSLCGICLSIWAVIQLSFMGYFYSKETVTLIEDVEPHVYDNYDDFIKKCEVNYQLVGHNCYKCAYLYFGILIISVLGLLYGRKLDKAQEMKLDDDEYVCNPPIKPKRKFWKKTGE